MGLETVSQPHVVTSAKAGGRMDSRLPDCVIMPKTPIIVILNEVKNLTISIGYANEILRLTPQNDIVTQSLHGNDIVERRVMKHALSIFR